MPVQPRLGPLESADERVVRTSAQRLGRQVMAICAALVLIGGLVILGFVLWQTTLDEMYRPLLPGEVELRLDVRELFGAVAALAVGAVVCAGVAARIVARRAVRPLADALERQRRFVADVSHELRTPLAVLDARVQHVVALSPADDVRRPVLDALREDVQIMSDVVDDLLVTATDGRPRLGSADLGDTLEATCRDLVHVAERHGVAIEVVSESGRLTVGLPATELRRCVVALLDNAIQHSPSGGTVTVAVRRAGSDALVTVTDQGAGITGIDPHRVFDRRAQGARPGRASGLGIGLALVRELSEAYGLGVRVADPGPGGTTFELRLPVSADESGRRP